MGILNNPPLRVPDDVGKYQELDPLRPRNSYGAAGNHHWSYPVSRVGDSVGDQRGGVPIKGYPTGFAPGG
jgi:hypothetical protein